MEGWNESASAQPEPLKVFISVDMEGIAGVVDRGQTSATFTDPSLLVRVLYKFIQ